MGDESNVPLDRRKRNAMWTRFTRRLLRYARTLRREPADAEDLVQECLLRVLTHEARNGSIRDAERYLLSSLRNLHITTGQQRKRQQIAIEDVACEPACCPAQIDRLEVDEVVRDLQHLPAGHSRALLLVALEGGDCRLAGSCLGIPVGTVRSRVFRARSALRLARGGS